MFEVSLTRHTRNIVCSTFALSADPRAEEKTLWIQSKRTVLAILRVQPGKDLVESLMQPVTEEDELLWDEVLETEMASDHKLRHPARMPSTAAQESAYRLEDIRSYVSSLSAIESRLLTSFSQAIIP